MVTASVSPPPKRAKRNSTMGTNLRSAPAPDGWAEPRIDPAHAPRLHRLEGFVDRDLGSGLQDRASLGKINRLVERVGLKDRIAARGRADRPVMDRTVARDRLGMVDWVAGVHHRRTELAEPRTPRIHHLLPLRVCRGHSTTTCVYE